MTASALTNIPNPRRKKKNPDEQLREHITGCARSEGYYAISRKEKDIYLDLYPGSAQELDYDNLVRSLTCIPHPGMMSRSCWHVSEETIPILF